MKQTRREFLWQSSCGLLLWPSSAVIRNDEAQKRAARWIEQYDRQGVHRTGTKVDEQSGRWLAQQARQCGGAPSLEPFTLNRVDPRSCYLQIGERRIEGLPIFDGGFTDAGGVRRRLGPLDSEAEIGLTEATPNAEYVPAYAKMRREARHRAIVLVTRGARPGLSPINASHFNEPYGPPILQVSGAELEWLKAQAEKRAAATFVAQVARARAQAFNVTAKIKGADARLAPLVVMTPRSGWGQCASERGGGLVCWLEMMRALAEAKPARDCLFVASSGHELGHLGLDHFLQQRSALVKDAHVWIHLGANIGAAIEPGMRLQASSEEFDQLAVAAMKAESAKVDEVMPRGFVPLGEARNIQRGGGRYISLVGRNGLFHHPADRWPEAVDVNAVAACARALVKLALALASETVN
jgi:hypothetical protein